MAILWTLFIGLIVGALAKFLMPGRDPGGIIITMALGIVGALVAGFLGRAFGWYEVADGPGLIASVIGAVVVLAVYRFAVGRTRTV